MKPEIKQKLEQILEKTQAFLSRSARREDLGSEIDLVGLALGVECAIEYIRTIENPAERAREITGLGYSSFEELETAYKEAANFYNPTFRGRPLRNLN